MNVDVSDYIVSVFTTNEDGTSKVGTGVLVGRYLISAAHTFKNAVSAKYKFQNIIYELDLKSVLVYEYCEDNISNIRKDLIIFNSIYNSPVWLSIDDVVERGLEAAGYHTFNNEYFKDNKDLYNSLNVISYEQLSDKVKALNNMLYITSPFPFYSGNSGCPLYFNGVVYGILLKSYSLGNVMVYGFLSSAYIYQILSTHITSSE